MQYLFRPVRSLADAEHNNRILRIVLANLGNSNMLAGSLRKESLADGAVDGEKAVTVIDDRDSRLVYSPTPQTATPTDPWYRFENDLTYYSNTVTNGHGDHATPQTVEFTFVGTEISVICHKAANCGKIDVQIDGGTATIVDLYSLASVARPEVFSVSGLSLGVHTIKLTVRADKNASSSAYEVYFDGLRVGKPLGLPNLDISWDFFGLTGTTNANGYKRFDTLNLTATGYSSLGITGVTLITPDPNSAAATKPKIGWTGRYIDVWDGPAVDTVAVAVHLLTIRTE